MNEFITITFIITLAVISPGPDFAIVMRNALAYSRVNGVYTALGIGCSTLFHSAYCILGLAIIISKSLMLFNVIKYIGAAYLIYIGICSIIAKRSTQIDIRPKADKQISKLQAFRQGLLCNALNPKAIFFFLALFTMVMKPGTPLHVQMAYAIEIALLHFSWFACLSVLITHHKIKAKINKIQHHVVKVMGVFLVSLGVRIAV
jgi:RhtB (resistance to homoserine/threonine) family protein